MRRLLCAVLVLIGSCGPLASAPLDAAAINDAQFAAKLSRDQISPQTVKLQVLLDRAHVSPGEIDGKFGENVRKAVRAFTEAKQLPSSDSLSREAWDLLTADTQPTIGDYTLTDADIAGPFLDKLPSRLDDMKGLKALSYTSLREQIAERFHMSAELLSALNPNARFDRAGTRLVVVNVTMPPDKLPRVVRIDIDKARQTVKAYDKSGQLVAFYPATVGSEEKPSPSGVLTVRSVSHNPTYRYNPEYHFKGVKSKTAFEIAPGPNNPVGSVWISLSAQGYGLHGTPAPDKVSKSQSHGCVRLTNWDAEQLAAAVTKGTTVAFLAGRG